ncbi:MAG: 6-phosphogluconolactonase, partial [Gammaproteobacteria bacterium]|nr:6-phosphogluconolactonase [Gammaproteobacteria bacterium]
LSGGRTPAHLYDYLAEKGKQLGIDWSRVHFYFSDERCVPPDSFDSNFGMAQQLLLSRVKTPHEQIHRIQGEKDPELAAMLYEEEIKKSLPYNNEGVPCFDLILLGLGTDGHTASLFPYTSGIEVSGQMVTANYINKLETWRVTLTFSAINSAKRVVLLAEGIEKRDILRAIRDEKADPEEFPILRVKPQGEYSWFLDRLAAE